MQSRPDRRLAIVFVTDGVLDLGTESVTTAKTRWLRDDLGLEAKRSDVSILTVAVSQAADFQVAQTLARTTGGEYYRAPSPALFTTALEQVTDRLTRMAEIGGVRPANPIETTTTAGPLGWRVVLVAVILIGLVVLCLAIVFARKRAERSGPGDMRSAIEEVTPYRRCQPFGRRALKCHAP